MENFKKHLVQVWDFLKKYINIIGIAAASLCVLWLVYDLVRTGLAEASGAGTVFGLGMLMGAVSWGLFHYFKGNWKANLAAWLILVLTAGCSFYGMQVCDEITEVLQRMAYHEKKSTEEISLYAYSQAPVSDLKKVGTLNVGVLSATNSNMRSLAEDKLKEEGVTIKIREYSSIQQMMRALRGQAVQTVLLEPFQLSVAKQFADLGQIGRDLIEEASWSIETEMNNAPTPVNVKEEPYTVLITSSMDSNQTEEYRSYLCLVAVVNPKSQEILLVDLPRNLWIGLNCSDQYACMEGTSEKISLMSYGSIQVLKENLEAYLQTPINYTVRIDMPELLNITDHTGPLKVQNSSWYTVGNTTFNEGENVLDKVKGALYARDIEDFTQADLLYQSNHYNLLKAIVNLDWTIGGANLKKNLDIISQSVQTNFSYEDLTEIARTFVLWPNRWKISEMQQLTADGFENSPSLTGYTYINYPLSESREKIVHAIQTVKDGGKPDTEQSQPEPEPAEESAPEEEEQLEDNPE